MYDFHPAATRLDQKFGVAGQPRVAVQHDELPADTTRQVERMGHGECLTRVLDAQLNGMHARISPDFLVIASHDQHVLIIVGGVIGAPLWKWHLDAEAEAREMAKLRPESARQQPVQQPEV